MQTLSSARGFILLTLILSSWPPFTVAQEDPPQQTDAELSQSSEGQSAQDGDNLARTAPSGRELEEIVVIGEPTFSALRLEIQSVETEAYALYNDLNSDDDFDVTCKREIYVGSHMPRRVCMAKYLRDAQADNTQRALQGIDVLLPLDGVKGEVTQKTRAMEADMLRVAAESAEFAGALQRLAILMGALNQKIRDNPLFFGR